MGRPRKKPERVHDHLRMAASAHRAIAGQPEEPELELEELADEQEPTERQKVARSQRRGEGGRFA